MYRLVGHSPGDFPPSYEAYQKFIHPDDAAGMGDYVPKPVKAEDLGRVLERLLGGG